MTAPRWWRASSGRRPTRWSPIPTRASICCGRRSPTWPPTAAARPSPRRRSAPSASRSAITTAARSRSARTGIFYIGMGDGGSGGDPQNQAQRPGTLLGKMLRIDVDVPDATRAATASRPTTRSSADAVAARARRDLGVRRAQPVALHVRPDLAGGTGAMLIGDVGQNAFEEIDYEPAGAGGRNYGWRIQRGAARLQPHDGGRVHAAGRSDRRVRQRLRRERQPLDDAAATCTAAARSGLRSAGATSMPTRCPARSPRCGSRSIR